MFTRLKELDHRGTREPLALREADGVDAHELVVVRGSDESVEHLEQVARAGNRSGEPLEPLRQERLIHNRRAARVQRGCGTILMCGFGDSQPSDVEPPQPEGRARF